MFLRKKYGNFAVFTLPMGIVSILSVSYLFGRIVYKVGDFLYSKIIQIKTIGFDLNIKLFSFDPFFISTQSFIFLIFSIYFLIIFAMIFGRKMTEGKWSLSLDMLYFFPIFITVTPFWLLKAIFNTILQRKPAWR